MIYLYFKGNIYSPGFGSDSMRHVLTNKEVALELLRQPLKDYEWQELLEINPETLERRTIILGDRLKEAV